MNHSNRIDGKRQRVKTVLATTLMFVTAALLMVPFYFMFLSSLKPGTEMLRNGLSLTFDPGVSSFKNYEALNTYRDGYKVIRMIFTLVRDERPLFFFSTLALILLIIAGIYFFPILFKYFSTGYVLKIPTLIMIATVVIVATIVFFTGVILYVLKKQHRDNLEHHLILLNELKEE